MKSKLKFIIPIAIAVIAIIVAALCIDFTPQERADVSSIMSTAQKYLIENQYEQAIAEFNKVIEIEPKNVDAYLGLAEAYVGIGDTEKAIEILEKGYEITGDDRLKEMLNKLLPPMPEETTVTTIAATEKTTTVSTAAMVTVPDLSGLTEEEAIAACESAGLNYSVSYGYSDVVENNYVMGQTIPANSTVAEGISVSFTVSKGATTTTTTTTTETTAITTTPSVTTTIKTTTTTPVTTTEATTTAKKQVPSSITINGNKYSTDLTELYLSDYTLMDADVENLSYLKKLKKISFSNIQSYTSDFSPLSDLPNLEELELIDFRSADYLLNTKNNWSNLRKLICRNSGIGVYVEDISFISNFTNLEYLDLSGNFFDDLSPISKLTNLTYLDVSSTANWENYRDLKPLAKLKNLKYLDLSLCNIKDITPLSELKNLEELNLAMNEIEDFSPIKSLKKLSKVGIVSNPGDYEAKDDLKEALPNCTIFTGYGTDFTYLV